MKTKKLIRKENPMGYPTPKKQKKCIYCKKEEAWITIEKNKVSFRLCLECLKRAVGNLL